MPYTASHAPGNHRLSARRAGRADYGSCTMIPEIATAYVVIGVLVAAAFLVMTHRMARGNAKMQDNRWHIAGAIAIAWPGAVVVGVAATTPLGRSVLYRILGDD